MASRVVGGCIPSDHLELAPMSRRAIGPGKWLDEGPTTSYSRSRRTAGGAPVAYLAAPPVHAHYYGPNGRCTSCGRIEEHR